MNLKRSLRSPLRPAALSPLQHALIAGGVTAPARTYPASFNILLSSPVGATIADGTGVVTINNINSIVVPDIQAARVSGVAPLSVFFDATGTYAPTLTAKPIHDILHKWDFGDTGAGTWATGAFSGSSKNLARGPVASHLFETPGTYTITLESSITSAGGTVYPSTKTVTVTVDDPDVVFASNTICFSTSGDFTGAPAGAAQVTTSNFKTAIETYQATKKRLLFRAGETFTSTDQAVIYTGGPGHIGKFGSGAAPKFTTTATNTFFRLSGADTPNIKDWRIVDLELDGQDGAAQGLLFQGGIDQVTMLRVNIHNVKSGISNSPGALDNYNAHANTSYHGHHLWDQFAFIDSQINTINGGVAVGGQIGIFYSGTRHTMMGSTVDPAYGGEHAVRNPYLDRAVLSHNYMARPAVTKHSWTLRGADQAVTGTLVGAGMATQKVIAAENVFFNDISAWTVTVAPQNTITDERLENIILERNYFVGGSTTGIGLVTRGAVKYLSIRNNVFNLTGWSSGSAGISADGTASISVPASTGHVIANNTFYRSDSVASFVAITLNTNANNYTIKNNLAYAPSATSRTVISGAIDSGLVTGGNSSNAQAATSPLFVSTPVGTVLSATDFKPDTGSYAINAGDYIQVFDDLYKTTRTGAYDIGAVQP